MKTKNPKLNMPRIVRSSRMGVSGYRIFNRMERQFIFMTRFQLIEIAHEIERIVDED